MGNNQTTKDQNLLNAEKEILKFGAKWCDSLDKSDERLKHDSFSCYRFDDVATSSGRTLHTVCFINPTSSSYVEFKESKESKESSSREPLILLHGYGGGIGNYFATLPLLAEKWRGRVFALDCYGCGNSSRPSVRNVTDRSHFENLMVEELEYWRKAMGIEKFSLCGHSMGGYLATCYAERYPSRVEILILASPVGVPEQPKSWQEQMKEKMGLKASILLYLWKNGWSPFTAVRVVSGKRIM